MTEGTARWFLLLALHSGRPHAALRRCPAYLDCVGAEANKGLQKSLPGARDPGTFVYPPSDVTSSLGIEPLFPALCPRFSCHLGQNVEAIMWGE